MSALTPAILAAVRAEMAKSPQAWTARQIADWVAEHYGIRLSPRQISRLVARAQQSYKRTQRGLKHRQSPEEVARKKAELAVLEKGGARSD
jgi:transposase